MVGQLLNGSGKLLQGLTNELGPCFQLRVVHCSQVVVTIAILQCPNNLVCRFSRDTM
jgi:hypothetical protein